MAGRPDSMPGLGPAQRVTHADPVAAAAPRHLQQPRTRLEDPVSRRLADDDRAFGGNIGGEVD